MTRVGQFIYVTVCGLIVVVITYFTVSHSISQDRNAHNCRFWGIIFTGSGSPFENTIRTHLDSLKSLGADNPDGWGISYYLVPENGGLLPTISRGEPSAPLDLRYDRVVTDVVNYVEGSAVAHVRSGSSGLTSGIPDPHPFKRDGFYRDFQMLFAHNGLVPVDVLLSLIDTIDVTYLALNPPDYAPDYLDSDLYSIFIMEMIDVYQDYSIEECIKMAITKIDSALGTTSAQFNFVMSDGSTLWAVHYTKPSERAFTLYYYPNKEISDYWVAASKPLDSFESWWVAVPNSTLVTLIPNQAPQLINIFSRDTLPSSGNGFELLYPNPFTTGIMITYNLLQTSDISLKIYDISGRLVRTLLIGTENPGFYTISWDGRDSKGVALPSGTFLCDLNINGDRFVEKVLLVK
jgi:predicted glutamine amidotransferase